MAQTQIDEGTAEEFAIQLRDSNLAGPLKAIVTQDEITYETATRRIWAIRLLIFSWK